MRWVMDAMGKKVSEVSRNAHKLSPWQKLPFRKYMSTLNVVTNTDTPRSATARELRMTKPKKIR